MKILHSFLHAFMYKGLLLAELWGFCDELVLPNIHLLPNRVDLLRHKPEHVDFQYPAWFNVLHDPVPISGSSYHNVILWSTIVLCSWLHKQSWEVISTISLFVRNLSQRKVCNGVRKAKVKHKFITKVIFYIFSADQFNCKMAKIVSKLFVIILWIYDTCF